MSHLVGEELTGGRARTYRTKAKLEENAAQLVRDVRSLAPLSLAAVEQITLLVNASLSWTADDVLAQAIADGYKPTQEGVI